MSRVVVDASVVLKWYFHEAFSEEALRVANHAHEVVVPDLIFGQVGAVLWRRVKSGEMKREDAHKVLANLRRLPLTTVSPSELAPAALEIATATARTFNESVYFALAMRERTKLVTADRWWFTLLSTGPMRRYLRWVGDEE
ncbi:type II toxin-antitoxin system VapC family toxin [Fimbriimonas ginsengisoli]|uniref:PilT domain-containing protein n=1 Tax=Fimbriimonas ginsengisoli Gsoil 348 TaxID=661478 RepID=A0A068NYS9_FIMGI|nr:type II toxin-antitoxin system VapC family toxin [Fimbriimonas ginsengisoli]AIE87354.1 PilT domain-containing protein [Fimbriimonas ginsengisoli Gsoil 348]